MMKTKPIFPQRYQAIGLALLMGLPLLVSGQAEWHAQACPVQEDLVSVSFADTLNGWAVSDSGTVIYTIDGGATWEVQQTLDDFLPEKIFFQDEQTGWMAGVDTLTSDTALIFKTINGGATWDTSHIHPWARLYDIFFINDTMGWSVGIDGGGTGLRLHTLDSGQSWSVQSGINVMGSFTSVHFRDTEEGDICGPGPVMMHTNSGGRGASPWALEITNLKKPMYDLVNVGDLYGCMVGADGKMFFTKDQWNNFIEQDYEGGDTLWSVAAIEPLGFWIAGAAGTILFVGYNDIFMQFIVEDQSLDIPRDLVDLDALDGAHAWAVGEEGTILSFGSGSSSGIQDAGTDVLQIFPNPASGQVRVSHIPPGIRRIEMYSLEGRLRNTTVVPAGTSTLLIDLSQMEAGSYILKAGKEREVLIITEE